MTFVREPVDSTGGQTAANNSRSSETASRRAATGAGRSARVWGFVEKCFKITSLVWLALIAVVLASIVSRNFSLGGQTLLEELQWHLYAVGFMVGVPYCFITDEHVRVNLLRQRLNRSSKLWIELFGGIFLLLPFILVVEFYAITFVFYSWQTQEVSSAPGGLPFRWIIKSFILIGFGLLLAALLVRLWQTARDLLSTKRKYGDRANRKFRNGN
ncbi:TRAP transporter small permease subunit [Roseovarius sp. CAU 1744]|uniref:TRAP transporter small permease subunit n=1 Tax=Roseovarius sp. CAU 1744 TaxID=3140368 RepID=UPI00325A8622